MSRHPYTNACDYIRTFGGYNENGAKMSRSEASSVRQGIAKAIGMEDEELAIKLSTYYQEHNEEIVEENFKRLEKALFLS